VGSWGIQVPIEGFEGQIISPWLEVALAAGYLRSRYEGEVVCFFGYDNAFLYLLHDPALSLALEVPLPVALGPNEYLLLNDAKMSTSGDHALDAVAVLEKVPADLLRLYLAGCRPEETTVSASLAHLAQLMELRVIQPWQNWLEHLGRCLTAEAGSKAPQPGDFSAEHHEVFGSLQSLLSRAEHGYQVFSLQEVSRSIHELIERVNAFAMAQANLAQIPALQGQRATALALELAAARCLCCMTAPLMPRFAAQLWKFLGFRTTLEQEGWPSAVTFVPPGQRVLATAGLCSRKFFPASLNLEQLVEKVSPHGGDPRGDEGAPAGGGPG
jgi:methionyl-tRNA synthetase